MPGAGALRDRYTFQKRGPDANGDPLGDWADQFTISAGTIYLKGSEPVMEQRLQGVQPVVLTVRDETRTRLITTAWRAVNARDTSLKYDIKGNSPAKDTGFRDVLAQSDDN